MRAPKKDAFFRSRDSVYSIWKIHCSQCSTELFLYQKDGRGSLKRAYLNRILAPENLASLQDVSLPPADYSAILCTHCGALIGTLMLHREGRWAFRLVPGAWRKNIYKGPMPR